MALRGFVWTHIVFIYWTYSYIELFIYSYIVIYYIALYVFEDTLLSALYQKGKNIIYFAKLFGVYLKLQNDCEH